MPSNERSDEMVRYVESLETRTVGDWSYDLDSAVDVETGATVYVVSWSGADSAWDASGELVCPVGDDTPGDQAGAKVFTDVNEAEAFWKAMITAVKALAH